MIQLEYVYNEDRMNEKAFAARWLEVKREYVPFSSSSASAFFTEGFPVP
jgi:hypothetical protein